MASPFDILRKPLTVHRRGVKANVMSWKGTVIVPEAGFVAGSIGAPSMPELPYTPTERKVFCTARDVASGAGAAYVSNVMVTA